MDHQQDQERKQPTQDDRGEAQHTEDEGTHSASNRGHEEEFKDEHLEEDSSERRAAARAQHVLNSTVLLDEKAVERELRAAAASPPRRPQKVKSDPVERSHSPTRDNSHPPFSQSENNAHSPVTRNPVVQFRVTPSKQRSEEPEVPDNEDVNLLHLAAERSRGVYRDIDSSSNINETEQNLLGGSANNPVETKLQHMDPNHHRPQIDLDAKVKAQAQVQTPASASSASASSNATTPTTSSSQPLVTPGSYHASPGMAIQRTPTFDTGVLRQPMVEDMAQAVRSSSTALPDPTALLPSQSQHTTASSSHPSFMNPLDSYDTIGSIISAVRVDQDDLELHIRDEIHNAAAQAEVVDLEKETSHIVETKLMKERKRYYVLVGVALALVAVCIVGMVLGILQMDRQEKQGQAHDPLEMDAPLTTLQAIRQRGYLNCGLTKRDETVDVDSFGLQGMKGFNKDICRAFAAAALGGDANVTFTIVPEEERWKALENGTLDVLLVGTPAASESLHWNLDPNVPVQFSTPYLFDGVGAGGMPDFVDRCAPNSGFDNFANCRDLVVCIVQGSKARELADRRLHPSQIVEVPRLQDLYTKFEEGCCNIIATDYSNDRAEVVVRSMSNYTGDYKIGAGLYSRQPYAAATRKYTWNFKHANRTEDHLEDPHSWSEFVNWVIHALFAAEEANITQETAYKFRQTGVFGDEYKDMFQHAIAAVGNYGQIYNRTRAKTVPRAGMNMLNDGTTGLHYGWSMGNLAEFGPPPHPNGTLANILVRGKLRCGMAMPQYINATDNQRLEFGPGELANIQAKLMRKAPMTEIEGTANIDFTYCRALTSAIFQGRLTIDDSSCSASTHTYGPDELNGQVFRPTVDIVMLKDEADGYDKLDRGLIDVVSGFRMDLQGDVWQEEIGDGFTFTQPYFYGPADNGHVTDNNRCMVTQQHDQQWSDFVQLVVASLFYAEEGDCTQSSANDMPVVNRFGPVFKRMMRDTVFAVGNYKEVYDRDVEPVYPREGTTNELNRESNPQFASMPGLLKD